MSGYGQTGPYAMRPAYDLAAQAMGGVMYITGTKDTIPLLPGPAMADVMTAQNITIAILLSLFGRLTTGIAQRVETSLVEASVASQLAQSPSYLIDRQIPMRDGSRFNNACPYEAYKAKDGYFVFADARSWKMFCEEVIEMPELSNDPVLIKMKPASSTAKSCAKSLRTGRPIKRSPKSSLPRRPCCPVHRSTTSSRSIMTSTSGWPGRCSSKCRLPTGTR